MKFIVIQIAIGIAIEIDIICCSVREESSAYGVDSDPDSDFDPEERNPNNIKCFAQILETSKKSEARIDLTLFVVSESQNPGM